MNQRKLAFYFIPLILLFSSLFLLRADEGMYLLNKIDQNTLKK